MEALFDPTTIYALMLIFSRAGGLLALAPAFSGQSVPVVIRVALAFLLATIFVNLAPVPRVVPGHFLLFVLAIGHEVIVGLLMGFAVRFIFYALEIAGQIMATEIGLIMSSSLDPISHTESSPATTALSYLGIVIFFVSGAHHLMLVAFLRSFELVPAAAGNFDPRVADVVVRESGRIFLLAVQMAAPLIAINFFVNLALAILSRAAPTINAFLLSIPIQIFAGMTVLSMVVGLTAHYVLSGLGGVPELMLRFIH
ncbi:MAG: flagellar biosynthesis protein FliR [Chthoniobacter sp.]|nr:flagellar biosynthesis protein FliR [Chthoniobacter sp.]